MINAVRALTIRDARCRMFWLPEHANLLLATSYANALLRAWVLSTGAYTAAVSIFFLRRRICLVPEQARDRLYGRVAQERPQWRERPGEFVLALLQGSSCLLHRTCFIMAGMYVYMLDLWLHRSHVTHIVTIT